MENNKPLEFAGNYSTTFGTSITVSNSLEAVIISVGFATKDKIILLNGIAFEKFQIDWLIGELDRIKKVRENAPTSN